MMTATKKILVHGHRGARALWPENTLPAFEYAIDQGVDCLELDMAVTKDNVVVVSHDPRLNPVIATGPATDAKAIREMTLAEQTPNGDRAGLLNTHATDIEAAAHVLAQVRRWQKAAREFQALRAGADLAQHFAEPANYAHDAFTEATTPHIASPDVHVDDLNRRIVMYYHGLNGLGQQVTRAANGE